MNMPLIKSRQKCSRPTVSGRPCSYDARSEGPPDGSCTRHMTAKERAAADMYYFRHAVYFIGTEPACWSWLVTDDMREYLALAQIAQRPVVRAVLINQALTELTQGRCALCGVPGASVEDHDHLTGRVRGELCRSCNIREGKNSGGAFQLYRDRNPYSMLGLNELYSGWGWENGRPVDNPGWTPTE